MLKLCFFFSSRRRHTRWPRDWSSDVCSSDLFTTLTGLAARALLAFNEVSWLLRGGYPQGAFAEIGRASCRERGEIRMRGGLVREQNKRQSGYSKQTARCYTLKDGTGYGGW